MIAVVETPSDIARFAALLWRPGDVREVRIPGPGRTDAGYFDSPDALVRAVAPLDGRRNVYVTANPVDPALLGRGNNRIVPRVRSTTADGQVTRRCWLPVDIDPRRPSDISASEAEREAALEVTRDVWRYLAGRGWPEPVTAMSGNGYWLLYPIDLPNDADSKRLVEGVLDHLAARFNSDHVAIDTSVSNAARIVALIGTLKVKGDATPTRPHRRSGLLRVPAELVPVPVHLLAELAPPAAPAVEDAIRVGGDRMPAGWVGALLDAAGIAYRPGRRGEQTWYRLARCPFHPDDDQGGDCGVGEDAQGKGLGHCFHNRGAGKGWRDFKAALGLVTARPPTAAGAATAKPPRVAGPRMDAADLLALDLPPIRWIVPGLIPEGTTILAAPPKVGKSCLIYQIAVEASIGGDVLGRRVTPGSVLYLALEDGKRRGQQRLLAALAGRTMPRGRLEVQWDARAIGAGLEDDIREWLEGHPDAVMVAIDTLGKVRPAGDGRRNAYEVDVAAMNELQNLFRDRPVGLVIVHHARKESTDDFLASVSGTYGITGSVDTIVVIRRKRNEAFGTIHVTGRDVADEEIPARFDELAWTAAPGALSAASFERTEVYRVIEERGPLFAKAIGEALGMERTAVQHVIGGLVERGAIARTRGGYVVAGVILGSDDLHSGIHSNRPIPLSLPLHSTHSQSEESEGSEESEPPHAGAREAGPGLRVVPADPTRWLNHCRSYSAHATKQPGHRQTPSGWTCDACYPEEGPA
ncbi:MAG TPA: AAA family ATPase [Patescibacteria group bacterium]|nr:AAA family ATPase [Patescibacteria group bacterium]